MADNSVNGDLQAFSIFDVTQSLMIGRKTAQVTIESGIKRGFLHFKEGQIVAALDDQFRIGEAAATSLFSWRGGTFCIDFDKEIDKQNIELCFGSRGAEVPWGAVEPCLVPRRTVFEST